MSVVYYKGEKYDFGERLKLMREERGINQSDLARRLDVARSTVSSWESNRTEPNMATVSKICEILHCKKNELIYGADKNDEIASISLTEEEELLVEAWRSADMTAKMLAYQTLLKSIH